MRWPTRRVQRGRVVVTFAVLPALVAACSSSTDDAAGSSAPPSHTYSAGPVMHEYRPGLAAFPHLPQGVTAAPVVVMVPGGGWQTADPSGLEPLAAALASQGVMAMPVVIRAGADGAVYPVPLEDVVCALADGVATAREAGIEPTRTVLLGHSSGAHLSALATLDPGSYTPSCSDPVVVADALVGLAGPYDIRNFSDAAANLFADDASDATWDAANPVLLAGQRPEVPVLLLHGGADELVEPRFSTDFADALRTGGHAVTLDVIPGVNHGEVYSAEVATKPVTDWLAGLHRP
ncbi:MAG: alpha/beta hydrolase [Ornithinibacter sp.]